MGVTTTEVGGLLKRAAFLKRSFQSRSPLSILVAPSVIQVDDFARSLVLLGVTINVIGSTVYA